VRPGSLRRGVGAEDRIELGVGRPTDDRSASSLVAADSGEFGSPYPSMYPPASTTTDCPVIMRLSSLARNSAALAMSDGFEMSRSATLERSSDRRVS
jgi:hypothetical protein